MTACVQAVRLENQAACSHPVTGKFTLVGLRHCATISVAKWKLKLPGWSHVARFSSHPSPSRKLLHINKCTFWWYRVGLIWGGRYNQSHRTWRRQHWKTETKACSKRQQKLNFVSYTSRFRARLCFCSAEDAVTQLIGLMCCIPALVMLSVAQQQKQTQQVTETTIGYKSRRL